MNGWVMTKGFSRSGSYQVNGSLMNLIFLEAQKTAIGKWCVSLSEYTLVTGSSPTKVDFEATRALLHAKHTWSSDKDLFG